MPVWPLSCFGFVFSAQVKVFVTGLFSLNQDIPAFKEHLRDFLVQIKVCHFLPSRFSLPLSVTKDRYRKLINILY